MRLRGVGPPASSENRGSRGFAASVLKTLSKTLTVIQGINTLAADGFWETTCDQINEGPGGGLRR